MISEIVKWGEFVKLSHTVFALPFALASMTVAARETRGWPGWRLFLLIVGAVLTARTCAMSFNRIVDRHFDKENPRTAERHLPTGRITLISAWILCVLSAGAFLTITYHINFLCFVLSPVALAVVCFYSLTKRFTDFTHIYLGIALSLAPLGAWLAVRGTLHIAPVVLALAVVCWLIGFDVIYALQDYDFDRTHGLHSLVVRWGPKNALQFSFLLHMLMWGLLTIFGIFSRFWVPYYVGLGIILFSLLLEHLLARRRSLKWINVAFFRLNALVSIVFVCATAISVAFPWFRAPMGVSIPYWM
jgi:4-hydroxybenzoate polyprenyltransferase